MDQATELRNIVKYNNQGTKKVARVITVTSGADLTLERLTVQERAPFFEEVFNIRPQIRQKKKLEGGK